MKAAAGLVLLVGSSRVTAQTIPITNPGFESDAAVATGATGWAISDGAMYVTAGANLNVTEPTSAFQGTNFLTANRIAPDPDDSFPANQTMEIHQDVPVTAFAGQIGTGGWYAEVSFAYCASDYGDNGLVTLEFRDAALNPLGTASFDTLTKPTANGLWSTATFAGALPVNTHSIRLSITSQRVASTGSQRNVSFDDFSIQLTDTPPPTRDVVHGNLIQFTENGAWCWFQDERAIVDTNKGVLAVGSLSNYAGIGGEAVDGQVRVTQFDLATGLRTTSALHDHLESYGGGDEHNAPAMVLKEDGDILTFYAAHNRLFSSEDDRSYYRTFDQQTGTWGSESEYHWWPAMPANSPGAGGASYSNVYQLSAEDPDSDGHGRLYNFCRVQQYPQIMVSDDNGVTWNYGGQLVKQAPDPPSTNYVNGYYRYISNGVDRIDFLATEFHPGDYNTSIYHAYLQGGKMHDSTGVVIDDDIFSGAASYDAAGQASTADMTPVFLSGAGTNTHAWNTDIQTHADGTITALFKVRAGTGIDDHRVRYGRFDPLSGTWSTFEIARAGGRVFSSQHDYTGLGALDPNDPDVLYISTEIDPGTDEPLAHYEIFKGVTDDDGATWTWTAITENSSYDNLRPIIPQWAGDRTALLWFRGNLNTSQNFDAAVAGVILGGDESPAIHYVDADAVNTGRADGGSFVTTTSSDPGLVDDQWHVRTGVGNAATVFAADEAGGENVPMLKTTVSGLEPGLHDVYACFWCDSGADWRLLAGLAEDDLKIYRVRGTQHAQADDFASVVQVDEAGRGLYRAYLGRVELAAGEALEVFIDDHDGSGGSRVWYDGIGHAPVPAYEQWQIRYFGNTTLAVTAPGADPDGDGEINESEALWGTDPLGSSSRPGSWVALSDGNIALTWTSAPGQDYIIEYSSDLDDDWQELHSQTGASLPATTTTFDDPIDVPRRFYRVRPGP